jgi:dATP pyrophosphohydrolase
MPRIVSDIVDTYLFRKFNGRTQFLVLRCKPDAPAGDVWHAIHSKIEPGETAIDAARRDILRKTSLTPVRFYTADYIGQFYDPVSDTIVLAPTLAALIGTRAHVTISQDYMDYAWCDLEETTARLIWSAQRWAVRHIHDIIVLGEDEAEIYSI